MAKVKFTAGRIDAFVCEPGKVQSFLWDTVAPGLGLRVTGAGARSYIFQGKLDGRTLRITIGDPKSWTIEQAQSEARRLKVQTDDGQDPRQTKRDAVAARELVRVESVRKNLVFGDVWPLYLDASKTGWGERHYRDHLRLSAVGGQVRKRSSVLTMAGPLASLLDTGLKDMTAERLAVWLEKESASRPTSAAQSYRLLRAFIRWCDGEKEFSGLIPAGAYQAQKVKKVVQPTKAKEGDSLQREQLPLWLKSVREVGNPVISAYLQALLITGARREEMAGLKWADVDFQWRSMTIRDKVEGQRIIPLTPYLASLLSMLPRRNQWVFSSPTAADGKVAEPRIAHNDALAKAGLPHVTLHGLRRSFGTLCEWVEMPSGISAQIMGYKPSALAEKHYRRRPLDLLRMWHDKIEAWLLEQGGIPFDAGQVQSSLRVVSTHSKKAIL